MAEQVQAQPHVLGGRGRGLEVRDGDRSHLAGHPAYVVRARERGQLVGNGGPVGFAERRCGVPDVEHRSAARRGSRSRVPRQSSGQPLGRHSAYSSRSPTLRAAVCSTEVEVAPQVSRNSLGNSSGPVVGWDLTRGTAGGRCHVTDVRERLGAEACSCHSMGSRRTDDLRRHHQHDGAARRVPVDVPDRRPTAGVDHLHRADGGDLRRDAEARPRSLRAVRVGVPAEPGAGRPRPTAGGWRRCTSWPTSASPAGTSSPSSVACLLPLFAPAALRSRRSVIWLASLASLVYVVQSGVTHRRLQPWCPQCGHQGGSATRSTLPSRCRSTR